MSLFSKSVSFLAVFAVIPASYALTARPSVIGTAAARMPTMTSYITGTSSSGTTISGTTTSSLLGNQDCIDAYTECMKGSDACGSDFEECTTKILFNGKMSQCLSTLSQCSTTGISSLFGTGTITALSSCAKDSNGDYVSCTYPTDGSLLGQMITSAAISNKYDTGTCVKRYTSCLQKDSVCGQDFELCTTDKEFRKQRVFCESTLARCQAEGKTQLFGSTNTSNVGTGRISDMMEEGAALAAANSVNTCYKIAEQCILNACADNPFRCYENSTQYIVDLVENMNKADGVSDAAIASLKDNLNEWGRKNVNGYIKSVCLDTIGGSKYCHITADGKIPSASQLKNEEERDRVYEDIYATKMNTATIAKISDLVTQFDTKTKNKCADTIKSCVMRTCGGGSGAACYSAVFDNGVESINKSGEYKTLQTGCGAIVNSDPNCIYAALNPNSAGTYTYQYRNADAFTTLFPEYDETKKSDPIGVVAALNASLQNSYNKNAIAQMRRRCQNVASSCVKTMCGTDYQNCYRNRTDVYSDLTNTGNKAYDNSMNKVGGVLDYTTVLGLCLDTVKNASACEEHLKIEEYKIASRAKAEKEAAGWLNSEGTAYTSVHDGWIDAGSATTVTNNEVWAEDENGERLCTAGNGTDQATCDSVDAAGNVYDTPVMISSTAFQQSKAASSLFKDLVYDLEKEAQAKYNAKLTREQNQCLAGNNGGIKGKNDLGSTFQWVKLRSSKVPKEYPMAGLKDNQFVPSNDIYGSFCRVRVTLQSDEKKIQDIIAKGNATWGTAYFAAGDAFTCGSWIPESALTDLATSVASDARDQAGKGNKRTQAWMGVLGTLAGGGLGAAAGNKIADSNFLGGLTGGTAKSSQESASSCVRYGNQYLASKQDSNSTVYLTRMLTSARKINTNKSIKGANKDDLKNAIDDLQGRMADANLASRNLGDSSETYDCVVRVVQVNEVDTENNCGTSTNQACNNQNDCNEVSDHKWVDGKCYKSAKVKKANGYSLIYQQDGVSEDTTSINDLGKKLIYCKGNVDTSVVIKYAENLSATKDDTAKIPHNYNTASTDTVAEADAIKELNKSVTTLISRCGDWDDDSAAQKTKSIGTLVGAGVGAVAGGVLAVEATKSVQNAKLDKVEQEAYDQFMSEVGNHITCMIGSEPAGTFGDIVETTLVE